MSGSESQPSSVDVLTAQLAEARRDNVLLAARVVELSTLVESLTVQVAELTRRLGMDSRNSSKPPSSDNPNGDARIASSTRGEDGSLGRRPE